MKVIKKIFGGLLISIPFIVTIIHCICTHGIYMALVCFGLFVGIILCLFLGCKLLTD